MYESRNYNTCSTCFGESLTKWGQRDKVSLDPDHTHVTYLKWDQNVFVRMEISIRQSVFCGWNFTNTLNDIVQNYKLIKKDYETKLPDGLIGGISLNVIGWVAISNLLPHGEIFWRFQFLNYCHVTKYFFQIIQNCFHRPNFFHN